MSSFFVAAVVTVGGAIATGVAAIGAAVASVGTFVAGAVGLTGLSTVAVTAIGSGVISGTITAIQGGSLSDVLKSAVIGGTTAYVGGSVGNYVSKSVTAGISSSALGPYTPGAVAAGNLAGNVAAGVTRSAIMGQDLERGAILGVAASTTSLLNLSADFRALPDTVKSVVSASASTLIRGGDVKEAAVMAAITSGNIIQKALAQSPELKAYMEDPKNKYATEIALTTMNTALAASLVGGDVSKSTEDALVVASIEQMSNAFKEEYTTKVTAAQKKYAEAEETQKKLEPNYTKQKQYAAQYEKTYAELTDAEKFQNDAIAKFNAKKSEYDKLNNDGYIEDGQFYVSVRREYENGDVVYESPTQETEAYNKKVNELNAAAEEANKKVAEAKVVFDAKLPQLQQAEANIKQLQEAALPLEQVYAAQVEDVTKYTNDVVEEGQKFVNNTNKSIISTLVPDFNADEYSKINALGSGVDPYTHYINFGKKEDAPINYKSAAVKDFSDVGMSVPPSIADTIAKHMKTSTVPVDALDQYFNEHTLTPEEVIAQAAKTGIKLSYEEAMPLAGYGDKTKLSDNLGTYLTTRTESDKKLLDTKEDVRNAITSKLQAEGYNVAANDPTVDKFYTAQEKAIRENISNMEDEARRIGDIRGKDSEEYKNIARQVLDAKADFGGYGVIKTDTGYRAAGAGEIDGSTMVMASKNGGYFDPVTNSWTIFISGTSDTEEQFTQKRLDETGIINGNELRRAAAGNFYASDDKYAAAFAAGDSSKPPEEGSGSYFGGGSGSTTGGGDTGSALLNKLGNTFSPIAFDDGSGKSLSETSNGFALITLGDGRTVAVNKNNPKDTVWLTPEQLKQYQDKVSTTKAQVTQPTPIRTIDEIRQSILDQIRAGSVTGTGVTTGEGPTTGVNQGTGGVDTGTGTIGGTGDAGGGTQVSTGTGGASGSGGTNVENTTVTPPKTDTTTPPTGSGGTITYPTPPKDTTKPPVDTTTPPTAGGTKPTMPTGEVGDISYPTQLRQRQQRTDQLMSLLGVGGGGGGVQQQQVNVKAPELAKINYIYDISGPSIFAGPQNNSLYGTETGTVDDLQKIMKR
jgi:hypothetical protein